MDFKGLNMLQKPVNVVYGNNHCSQIHTKHTYTLCGQNAELSVKLAVHIVTTWL